MEKYKHMIIANAMLAVNLFAVIGSTIITVLLTDTSSPVDALIMKVGWEYGQFIDWSYLLVITAFTIWYERPIRQALRLKRKQEPVGSDLMLKARQRLLNEPYNLIIMDFVLWIGAGLAFMVMLRQAGAEPHVVQLHGVDILLTALITVTVSFFLLQTVLQKSLAPVFFPKGALSTIPGTRRIRIGVRLLALTLAANIVPLSTIILTHLSYKHSYLSGLPAAVDILNPISSQVIILSLIFMAVGVGLTLMVAGNLSHPLNEMIGVLKQITHGTFDRKVRVITNDEIGYTGDAINIMTEGLKERELIKETFGQYVSREVRDEILGGGIPLDGEMKEVTVLFADLRNFTPMTEAHPPKQVVKIINEYFEKMSRVIESYGGLVLQFIGDEIMAVFGAPVALSEHPSRAFHAALDMSQGLKEVNRDLEKKGQPTLNHGIGMHTGKALAANIGSSDRRSYALIGDTVNLSSRLQELNKKFGTEIILSETTRSRLKQSDLAAARLKKLPLTPIRGKNKSVRIYAVI